MGASIRRGGLAAPAQGLGHLQKCLDLFVTQGLGQGGGDCPMDQWRRRIPGQDALSASHPKKTLRVVTLRSSVLGLRGFPAASTHFRKALRVAVLTSAMAAAGPR